MLTHFPVFESIVFFSNVISSVSMNLNPFMSFIRLSKCDSTNALVFVKWFNGFKLSWSSIPCDFACPLRAWFSSFILGTGALVMCSSSWSGLSVLGFGIGLYPFWNCSGGGNMMSSLMLFDGMGSGFMLSHFPALSYGIGLIISSCSLTLLLGFLDSCFNSNFISCDLLNLLRSFLFIFILYDLVFKPLLGKVVI